MARCARHGNFCGRREEVTRVVISQPMYFPWPGFFEQMKMADIYIWLDDAQFSKGSFTNRIQVNINRQQKWMSIPLEGKGTWKTIRELKAVGDGWRSAHRDMLRQSLSPLLAKEVALEIFDRAIRESSLIDCLIQSAILPAAFMETVPPEVLRSSDLAVEGASWQRVLDLVKTVGGTSYITGHGASAYLNHEAFERENITVEYMEYSKTPWGDDGAFISPFVTVLELIASEGSQAKSKLRPRTVGWRKFLATRN